MMNNFVYIYSFFLGLALTSSHPLILCLFLVMMACVSGGVLLCKLSIWAMNAIILIFLGGMMILFLYISTLSNNEKLNTPKAMKMVSLYAVVFSLPLMVMETGVAGVEFNKEILDFSLLFSGFQASWVIFILVYLLLTLFSVVKISESFKGALLKKAT